MAHASEKNIGFLILKGCESAADRILGPALWIALLWILKKSAKRRQHLGDELRQMELAHQVSRFGRNKIVSLSETFAQSRDSRSFRRLAELVQSCDLFLKRTLARHA